jgi:hypothetical protein
VRQRVLASLVWETTATERKMFECIVRNISVTTVALATALVNAMIVMAVDFARYLSRPNRFALVTFLALLLVRIVGVLIESK